MNQYQRDQQKIQDMYREQDRRRTQATVLDNNRRQSFENARAFGETLGKNHRDTMDRSFRDAETARGKGTSGVDGGTGTGTGGGESSGYSTSIASWAWIGAIVFAVYAYLVHGVGFPGVIGWAIVGGIVASAWIVVWRLAARILTSRLFGKIVFYILAFCVGTYCIHHFGG